MGLSLSSRRPRRLPPPSARISTASSSDSATPPPLCILSPLSSQAPLSSREPIHFMGLSLFSTSASTPPLLPPRSRLRPPRTPLLLLLSLFSLFSSSSQLKRTHPLHGALSLLDVRLDFPLSSRPDLDRGLLALALHHSSSPLLSLARSDLSLLSSIASLADQVSSHIHQLDLTQPRAHLALSRIDTNTSPFAVPRRCSMIGLRQRLQLCHRIKSFCPLGFLKGRSKRGRDLVGEDLVIDAFGRGL